MAETHKPRNADQVREVVAWAFAEEEPLELFGAGTKRSLGRHTEISHALDLSALAGVSLYEPGELVLSAAPGTPIADIKALLDEQNQRLAFEPFDMAGLLGGAPGGGTLGGVVSCNLAGPRRISAGAARDHMLGVKGVSGRGEDFKSGGRVVKNVTGYDMSKLITGAYGTLGAITELTLKVLPKPDKAWTVVLYGLDEAIAIKALSRAAGSSHEVSALAHLPAQAAAKSAVGFVGDAGAATTLIRVEGPGPSVEHRTAALRRELSEFGESEELHSKRTGDIWREVGDVRLLPVAETLWRLSLTPSGAAQAVAEIRALLGEGISVEASYDWAGGLIWLALEGAENAGHEAVRAAAAKVGGHATLIRAAADIRTRVPVFHPQPPALEALNRRVKESLDPRGILNPGRM